MNDTIIIKFEVEELNNFGIRTRNANGYPLLSVEILFDLFCKMRSFDKVEQKGFLEDIIKKRKGIISKDDLVDNHNAKLVSKEPQIISKEPQIIKILNQDYELVLSEHTTIDNESKILGHADSDNARIKLAFKGNKKAVKKTMYHELIHAYLDQMGLHNQVDSFHNETNVQIISALLFNMDLDGNIENKVIEKLNGKGRNV